MNDLALDSMHTIPKEHNGVDYRYFSAELSRKKRTMLYLEIGVQNGVHLSNICAERAIGVDPNFNISVNVANHKRIVELHHLTSDTFFAGINRSWNGFGKIDLAFLDGFHVFEFLLRDFYNVERLARRNALIMMHDCLPLNVEMADRNEARSIERGQNTRFPGYWTGDVWKIVPILSKYRPDLRIVCADCHPTGLICVTGLDPASTILESCYLAIVDEFRRVPNDLRAIAALYRDNPLVRSEDILRDHDHSLYFRA